MQINHSDVRRTGSVVCCVSVRLGTAQNPEWLANAFQSVLKLKRGLFCVLGKRGK